MANIMTLGQFVCPSVLAVVRSLSRDGVFQALPVFERVAKGHIEGPLVVSWLG
ncbi:hypothetical protein FX987_02533 [Vreelandella titanicae]|uniref:Uncharacterized protein n=1 Tax=Vreelandella titanicae TaxID=664683 RepID=A0AAP9NMX3_9GAMM|nr:hypothetical protein FX987_02533 [Halomonas titanicae]